MCEHRCGWEEQLLHVPIPGSAILPTFSSTSAAVLTGAESIESWCRMRESTRQTGSGSRLDFEVWYEPLRQTPIALPKPTHSPSSQAPSGRELDQGIPC